MLDFDKIAELVVDRFRDCAAFDLYFKVISCSTEGEGHNHHILPKSMFPEYAKCKWNIVRLSVFEHLLAHKLLAEIVVNNKDQHRMVCAYNLMSKTAKERTPELLQRMRELNSGELNPMWGRKGKANPNFGKPFSEERKKNISESLKGVKHPNFGKKLSAETCLKRSVALTGRVFTQEHRDNLAKAKSGQNLGVPRSEDTKRKIGEAVSGDRNGGYGKFGNLNPNSCRIEYLGTIYNTKLEAAEAIGINKNTLTRWLKSGKATKLPRIVDNPPKL